MTRAQTGDEFMAQVDEWYGDSGILRADGFEDCVIGVGERCSQPPILVYDVEWMVKKLAHEMAGDPLLKELAMTPEECAREHISFNVTGAWVGEQTPLYLTLRRKLGTRHRSGKGRREP